MRGQRGVAPRDFQAFIDPSRVQSRGERQPRGGAGGEEDLILASRVRTGISRSCIKRLRVSLGGVAAKRNCADVCVAHVRS